MKDNGILCVSDGLALGGGAVHLGEAEFVGIDQNYLVNLVMGE